MIDYLHPTQSENDVKVACEICLKEIPLSEAKNEEASDYVFHFCGIDCYTKWKEQKQEAEDTE